MLATPRHHLVLCWAGQVVRSCGSSIVWVYSTLLIQLRVPNELQGRMMALEMALYVVRARRLLFGLCSGISQHMCGTQRRRCKRSMMALVRSLPTLHA